MGEIIIVRQQKRAEESLNLIALIKRHEKGKTGLLFIGMQMELKKKSLLHSA